MKVQHDAPVSFAVNITKVDKDKREVEGIISQEVLDHHNQVVDYESLKAVVKDWPGNIREMHQPKAVGRALTIECDDEARAIKVRSRISKGAPDTWEKVLDGTLSAYSIGGSARVVTEKNATGQSYTRAFMQKLTETSLVDNPACPTATFEICKSVDGQFVGVQPAEPEPTLAVIGSGKSALITKLAELAAKGEQIGLDVTKRAEPYDVEQALQCLAFLESLVANEMFEAEYASYVGEDSGTQKAEIALLRGAAKLLMQFLVSEFEAQFAGDDVAMSKARGSMDAAFAEFEKVTPVVFGKLDTAGQFWLAKAGARHSKADLEMIQCMHDTAISLGAACQKDADMGSDSADMTMSKQADETPATPETPAEPTPEQRATEVAQAAAAKIQNSAEPTPPIETPTPEPTPAVVETPLVKTADEPVSDKLKVSVTLSDESIQKLIASVADLQTQMEAQKAAHSGEVAELRKQIKTLEDAPMPGGPKTRATGGEPTGTVAEKRLASDSAPAGLDGLDPTTVEKVLTDLALNEPDELKRTHYAETLLKFRRERGIGLLAVKRETGTPQPLQS